MDTELSNPARPDDWHPLTLGQLDFWEEFTAHPDTAVSTVAHATRIEGPLDAAALAQAISRMTIEADVLALRFRVAADGTPQQSIDPTASPVLLQFDLRSEPDPKAAAQARMQADIDQPLNLLGVTLSAQWLIRTGDNTWIWYCRGHHIFLDGYSMTLIERRVAELYAEITGGGQAGRPFARFTDFLAEEAAYRQSPRHADAARFWQDYLAEGPRPTALRKGSENYPAQPRSAEIALTDLSGPLARVALDVGLGWPDLLVILTGLWLWANPDQDDNARPPARQIWLPFMSRLGSVSAGLPAMVVNILPFRITARPDASLSSLLRDLSAQLKQVRRHGRYRIEQITTDQGLGAKHRFFCSPLVNVLPFDAPVFPGCTTGREVLAAGPGDGFNATFAADSRGGGLMLFLDADPALTSAALFRHHCQGLPDFLRQALTGTATQRLSDLMPLTPA